MLEDILQVYARLSQKLMRCEAEPGIVPRVRTRSEIQHDLLLRLSAKGKRKSDVTFLLVDTPLQGEIFRGNVTNDEEVRALVGKKDVYLTFQEFAEIDFENGVPDLLFFLVHVVCGEDLANYYAEFTKMKAFKYSRSERMGTVEFLVERQDTNHIESTIKRQNKELIKKLQKAKPNAGTPTVRQAIRLFQQLKTDPGCSQFESVGIHKDTFVSNSVCAISDP